MNDTPSNLPAASSITAQMIHHTGFVAATELLERCHRSHGGHERPLMARLEGVSGVGKSSVFQAYEERYPRYRTDTGICVPVLYASIPSHPTPKALGSSLLEALGADDPTYGSARYQEDRFVKLANACGVELVLIDEIQHFVDRGRARSHTGAADAMKTMIEKLKKPTVLSGAPRAKSLFLLNNQLRNRFMTSLRLRPFSIEEASAKRLYIGFLKKLCDRVPEGIADLLRSEGFAVRLFCATDGLPRHVVDFVRHLRDVVAEGKEAILETAAFVFRRNFWTEAEGASNPFDPGFGVRRLTGPGEPYEKSPFDGDNHA